MIKITLPGRRKEVVELRKNRFLPEKATFKDNSITEGPLLPFTFKWFLDLHGAEYLSAILWLIKDWCWSQLTWYIPGFIAGSLALLMVGALFLMALKVQLYSEAWVAFGAVGWVMANFLWMVGEFCYENDLLPEHMDGELFYDDMQIYGSYVSLASVIWLALYFLVLVPFNVFFIRDRSHSAIQHAVFKMPPEPFEWFFRDMREYETLHLLLWAVKDCFWIWNVRYPYPVFFALTCLINLHFLFLFLKYKSQYIDFMHYISLLFWVLANGTWAIGELFYEDFAEEEGTLTDEDWEAYSWPTNSTPSSALNWRFATSWLFFFSALTLVIYYIQWIALTLFTKKYNKNTYEEYYRALHSDEEQQVSASTGMDASVTSTVTSTSDKVKTSEFEPSLLLNNDSKKEFNDAPIICASVDVI